MPAFCIYWWRFSNKEQINHKLERAAQLADNWEPSDEWKESLGQNAEPVEHVGSTIGALIRRLKIKPSK